MRYNNWNRALRSKLDNSNTVSLTSSRLLLLILLSSLTTATANMDGGERTHSPETPVLQKAVKHFSPLRHNDWEMYIKNCTGEIEYHTACHIDCRLDLLFSSSTTPTAIPLPNPSLSPALS
jgi:hypothetical protein